MRRLSGWMRLWIVLAILYLFPVSFFTILQMPKETDVKRQWAFATIDIVKKYDENRKNYSTGRILDAYSDMSYDEIIKRIRKEYTGTEVGKETPAVSGDFDKSGKWSKYRLKKPTIPDTEFDSVDKQYREKLSLFWREKTKTITIGVLFCVVPLIAVYLLGRTIGWIYRGFKADIRR